jgi:hypothetical protein
VQPQSIPHLFGDDESACAVNGNHTFHLPIIHTMLLHFNGAKRRRREHCLARRDGDTYISVGHNAYAWVVPDTRRQTPASRHQPPVPVTRHPIGCHQWADAVAGSMPVLHFVQPR